MIKAFIEMRDGLKDGLEIHFRELGDTLIAAYFEKGSRVI
jgi:hypothetical protein